MKRKKLTLKQVVAKKLLAFVMACFVVLFSVSGCGEKETELLDVWCTDGSQGLAFRSELMEQQVNKGFDIDVTVFGWHYSETGYEERTLELQNKLMAGDGPDLVLFYPEDFRDVRKLAESGCFMDLSEFVEKSRKIDEDDFVEGIMQDGWYGDECYYIPLGFKVESYVTTDIVLDEQGWTLPQNFGDLLEQMDAYSEDNRWYKWFLKPYGGGEQDLLFEQLLMAGGIELVDYETETVLPDEAKLKDFLAAYKGVWEKWVNVGDTEMAYIDRSFHEGEKFEARDFCYSTWNYGLISVNDYTFTSAEYGTHLGVLRDYDGNVSGSVAVYAAISANSDRAEEAFKLVERMLGKPMQRQILTDYFYMFYFPVRKDCITYWLDNYNEIHEGSYIRNSSDIQVWHGSVSEDVATAFETEIESAVVVYNSPAVIQMLWDTMQPYFAGTAEYETCLEELRGKLEFYAKE